MNICQIIPIFIIIVVFGMTVVFVKPAEIPKDNRQRWVRSIVMGVSTALIIIIGFFILGLKNGANDCLGGIKDLISPWMIYLGLPAFIVTTIGYYLGYRQLYWLHSIRKKIDRK